ncbi:pro-FMRFamide-related neuropeptide VF [Nerophis lumbriciformis]|uniref:pro-FMRFamide-related neuropeptide VF n=1 Tax=Nerophis lumbriciformis TaxID=546530 RepID=UPI002ADF1262|nr:pro-FMRFamide-related neuropeptide VF [Nerophis lumbriciformis]
MEITILLSALLMATAVGLGGGAAVFDLKVSGISIQGGRAPQSSDHGRHAARRQTHQEQNGDKRRSLDLESFKIYATPTTIKTGLPRIVRLYPPTAKPANMHANMPMRFGRENVPGDDKSQSNMPQRFGRSREESPKCADCFGDQRKWPKSPYWRLLRMLARVQFWKTGLSWSEDFYLMTRLEEMETQIKTLQAMM